MFQNLIDRIQGKAPPGAKRSSRWRTVRNEHLKKQPKCQVCGGTKKLEVHHVIPFHVAPDLELDPENLMTLCEAKRYGLNCHQLIGHLGNYRRFNQSVHSDAAYWAFRLNPQKFS